MNKNNFINNGRGSGQSKDKITNPNFGGGGGGNFPGGKGMGNSNTSNVVFGNEKPTAIGASSKAIVQKIKMAKSSGVINLSNMNMDSLPNEIFDINSKIEGLNWWEVVEITKIDASINKFSQIKNDFNFLPALNYLKFSNNLFITIPQSIYNLKNLKYLDFSNNEIAEISPNICNMGSLVELNFAVNKLNFIPAEINFLKNLEVLNLSSNKIKFLPTNFRLPILKKLDLSENLFISLQPDIENLPLLEELLVYKNRIDRIENNCLDKLLNLRFLDMHINLLQSFTSVPKSDKLDSIILGNNKIEKIFNLENCKNLTVLDLNSNKLEQFPGIVKLEQLTTINLMNNNINDLPIEICLLKKLVRINLEGNPLKRISQKYKNGSAEQLKIYLKTKMNDEELIKYDSAIGGGSGGGSGKSETNILNQYLANNILKMNGTKMTEIPASLADLNVKSILSIDLSNNLFTTTELLDEIPFPELKEIKINENKLKDISFNFLNYHNLRTIELRKNQLSSFLEIDYKEIGGMNVLPNLEYLDLSINNFSELPLITCFFKNLKTFICSVVVHMNYLLIISKTLI